MEARATPFGCRRVEGLVKRELERLAVRRSSLRSYAGRHRQGLDGT